MHCGSKIISLLLIPLSYVCYLDKCSFYELLQIENHSFYCAKLPNFEILKYPLETIHIHLNLFLMFNVIQMVQEK